MGKPSLTFPFLRHRRRDAYCAFRVSSRAPSGGGRPWLDTRRPPKPLYYSPSPLDRDKIQQGARGLREGQGEIPRRGERTSGIVSWNQRRVTRHKMRSQNAPSSRPSLLPGLPFTPHFSTFFPPAAREDMEWGLRSLHRACLCCSFLRLLPAVPSMERPPQESALHRLPRRGSFPQAAVLRELLQRESPRGSCILTWWQGVTSEVTRESQDKSGGRSLLQKTPCEKREVVGQCLQVGKVTGLAWWGGA